MLLEFVMVEKIAHIVLVKASITVINTMTQSNLVE